MAPRNKSSHDDGGFIQEQLYIEEYPYEIPKSKPKEEDKDDIERGVIVIDLL
ncbi:MAG TPA: hypothetical protein VM577_19280 [Anaerovoracaceae bacterium]|nr:hypothetical protein [Anaerovoracaceae bacterium]